MMYIAESFVGSGPNAAHINVFVGPRNGPVGIAMAAAAAAPRMGYIPFMTVLKPNVPVKPATLFAAKADLRGERHEIMTWGPAQAGVAQGVTRALLEGVLPPEAADEWGIIAAVWVNWSADDADAVFRHNRQATFEAIQRALSGQPTMDELRAALADTGNPFYTPPGRGLTGRPPMDLRDPSLLRTKAFINGAWIEGAGGRWLDVTNPATGALIARVPSLGAEETAQAIAAAETAWPAWRARTARERAQILRRWFELMHAHSEDLALLLTTEQGKPLAEARGEVAYAASFIEWFAEEGKRAYGDVIPAHRADARVLVLKQPVGVVAAITPWNFPYAMVTRKVAPALAAG